MKKGYTLIELLITMAILLIIFAIVSITFPAFRNTYILNKATDETFALIQDARSKTLSSEGFTQYGVHFATASTTLFSGTVFIEGNPSNSIFNLPDLSEITSVSLEGGGNDLVFERLTGATSQNGSITISSKADLSKNKIINIGSTGIINVQ
ncbi:MAG: hypothetical protein COU27_00175 [Candidatus Levybacteria bacterium CG10_big_fil_rev_8_21_14_0_10_36_7]|nr:MAG: hypothetical protein COU27_00175 [Candidatus Levybacteria bacterium CG10_big_fil_rev_8_21_14_0_10_36_7]